MAKEIERRFTKVLTSRLGGQLHFIQAVIGPRQVGKTTGLRQIVSGWQGPSLMVTADEIAAPDMEWITIQWEKARRMGDGVLFVIDEIQKIPRWSSAVKRLFDQDRDSGKIKVVLLGSASLSLQRGLGESLAGRFEIIPADHWDLGECREAFGWGLDEYLKFGGYPAAATLIHDVPRWQKYIRDSIIEPVLIKDILGLSSVQKPALFRRTFELAMAYPAREVSLQKLLGQLQESGNVTSIRHYLDLLQGAFLIRTLQKYSGSKVRSRASSPKILPLNNALVHAFQTPEAIDTDPRWYGRVLETAVGAALSRSSGSLYYWRDGKQEIDFVVELAKRLYAIEVKSGAPGTLKGLERFRALHPECIPIVIDRETAAALLASPDVDEFLRNAGG
ncbi:MAG: ATP-binding protein [Candidatus Krumholzibacteria bacterium]|nr:ATP-binding protein [Candidatus Krumholzibacteria bacterium]